jgi:hypothetical protein
MGHECLELLYQGEQGGLRIGELRHVIARACACCWCDDERCYGDRRYRNVSNGPHNHLIDAGVWNGDRIRICAARLPGRAHERRIEQQHILPGQGCHTELIIGLIRVVAQWRERHRDRLIKQDHAL